MDPTTKNKEGKQKGKRHKKREEEEKKKLERKKEWRKIFQGKLKDE